MDENTGEGGPSSPLDADMHNHSNPMTIYEYIDQHRTLRDRGDTRAVAPATAQNYVQFIDSYFDHTATETAKQWGEAEEKVEIIESIESWLEEAGESHDWKPSTKGIAAFAVANWYATVTLYRIDHKILPFGEAASKASDDFEPRIWSISEVEEVMDYAVTLDNDRILDAMVIGWKCICRNREIAQMELDDVDLDKPYVTIRGVKGSEDYTFTPDDECLYVDDPCPKTLWSALESRVKDAQNRDSEYLFASGDGHIVPDTIGYWFGSKVCKHGIYDEWRGMHALCRHTRITHLIENGYSVDECQRWARHRFRSTTQRYDNQDILRRL